jgi:hypothetical protein
MKRLICYHVWLSYLAPAMAGRRFQSLFCTGIANNLSCQIRLINKNQETEIWSAWQKLRIICIPMLEQHIMFPNCSFCYFSTAFPITGIRSVHLSSSSCWEGDTLATHFGMKKL